MLKEKKFERVIQQAFPKKQMQFYKEKMPQIAIKIEKTSKKFGILPFLCNFCRIFDTLASLES